MAGFDLSRSGEKVRDCGDAITADFHKTKVAKEIHDWLDLTYPEAV
ncbi:hypothetical protein [Iodobacter fluviatilis]|nr:hypothetical protein [Iodobacter fluviatilis]